MTSHFRSMAVYRKPPMNKAALCRTQAVCVKCPQMLERARHLRPIDSLFIHTYKIIRQYFFKFNLQGILYFQRDVLL